MFLLHLANVFFYVFHTLVVAFILSGWAVPRWRKWHRILILITAFSWIGMGYFYGWGYCFLTDWHFEVIRQLGYEIRSYSYIHHLITGILPELWPERITDIITVAGLILAAVFSLFFYFKDKRRN